MTGDDAFGGSGAGDPIESLLEECITRAERDGDAGVDEVCARNPAHAETLRRELSILRGLGLLDAADTALYIIKSRGKATQTKELPPSARPSARKAA